jgi:hypothetical protein
MGSSHLEPDEMSLAPLHLLCVARRSCQGGDNHDIGLLARLGCMKTAKVFRLTPAAAGDEALRTKCGVACSSPPEWICMDSPTCSHRIWEPVM